MRLEYFLYLIELSKHSSMSEASKALHITTPALSIALKKLEDEFATKLIYTDNKGTTLTEKGNLLVKNSQKFFNFLTEFKNENNIATQTSNINLLAAYGARDDFMATLHKQLKEDFPHILLNTTYTSSEMLLSEFLSNNYDLGLLYNTFVNGVPSCYITEEIEFIPLFTSNLYCVTHKDSIISNHKTISLNTLARLQIPIIILATQSESLINLLNHFPAIQNKEITESYPFLLKQLTNNLGVTLSSTSLSSNYNIPNIVAKDCSFIKISDDISFQLGFIKKKDNNSINIYNFINYVSNHIRNFNKFSK